MANYTTSPNMSLKVPTVSTDPGPDYAQHVSEALTAIDGHQHTGAPDDGLQLVSASINVDEDLSINEHNLTNLRTIRYADQDDDPDGVGDVGCTYLKDGDLWLVNGDGTPVQITDGAALNTGSTNTTFTVQDASTNWTIAALDQYVILQMDTSATRSVTLPTAANVAAGRLYIVADKTGNAEAHPVTINRASTDTINGATTHVLRGKFAKVLLWSNGVNGWHAATLPNLEQGSLLVNPTSATVVTTTGDIELVAEQDFTAVATTGNATLQADDGNVQLAAAASVQITATAGGLALTATADNMDLVAGGSFSAEGSGIIIQSTSAALQITSADDATLSAAATMTVGAVGGGLVLTAGAALTATATFDASISAGDSLILSGTTDVDINSGGGTTIDSAGDLTVTITDGDIVLVPSASGRIDLSVPTTTSAPSAGAGGALPATPAGYFSIKINGTVKKVAYYD